MSVQVENVWVELDVKGHDHLSVLLFAGDRMFPESLGWAEGSNPSDSLRQLFQALQASLSGESPTGFEWSQDPGKQRWTITRQGNSGVVRLHIEESGARVDEDEDGRNTVLADFEVPLGTLARAFAETAARIRDDVGSQSYADHWDDHPFPSDELEALTNALDTFTNSQASEILTTRHDSQLPPRG